MQKRIQWYINSKMRIAYHSHRMNLSKVHLDWSNINNILANEPRIKKIRFSHQQFMDTWAPYSNSITFFSVNFIICFDLDGVHPTCVHVSSLSIAWSSAPPLERTHGGWSSFLTQVIHSWLVHPTWDGTF